jgi:hypothetical protein
VIGDALIGVIAYFVSLLTPAALALRSNLGKQWRHDYVVKSSTEEVRRSRTATVVAWEEVTVPAGKFWSFRIEATDQRLDRRTPADDTYWFVPSLGQIVKRQSTNSRDWNFVLLEIERAGP